MIRVTKKNLMALMAGFAHHGLDSMLIARGEDGGKICLIASSEEIKSNEEKYLTVNRLLNFLKERLLEDNNLELEFKLRIAEDSDK